MTLFPRSLGLGGLLLVFTACGSVRVADETIFDTGGTTTGTTTGTSGGTTGGSSTTTATTTGGSGGASTFTTDGGLVGVVRLSFDLDSYEQYIATATFGLPSAWSGNGSQNSCIVTTDGADPLFPYPDAFYQLSPGPLSAGNVVLTDLSAPDGGPPAIGTLSWSADAGYPQLFVESAWWSAGDSIGVSATGATVPAFDLSGTAPEPLAGVSPGPTELGGIPTSSDFTVHWTPALYTDYVELTLTTAQSQVLCVVLDDAAVLTVPHALFAGLAGASGWIELVRSTVQAQPVGSMEVYLFIDTVGLEGPVTFTP
jgi:hypothetical protein